jgi:hypothetical protein
MGCVATIHTDFSSTKVGNIGTDVSSMIHSTTKSNGMVWANLSFLELAQRGMPRKGDWHGIQVRGRGCDCLLSIEPNLFHNNIMMLSNNR